MLGEINMCKFYKQILDATNNYKNTVFKDQIGKNIFAGMTMETKVHFMQKHPSI